jgi:hypothetical protein
MQERDQAVTAPQTAHIIPETTFDPHQHMSFHFHTMVEDATAFG